jgi:predicted dinucleotide-binding enzyme
MRIAVLGTGMVGQAIAGKLDELGHEVSVGTRDPGATTARTEPDGYGNPPLRDWLAARPRVRLATFADAAAGAELVVNATSGGASLEVLESAGAANLAGKVIVDIANPLDFSHGMPPTLFVKDTDSLAERIQRAFPESTVVKALNMVNATVMVDPASVGGGDHSTFISGDDVGAKQVVTGLLKSFGHTDIIDLGDISTARGSEMMLAIWLRLYAALGTPAFAFKIVR